MMKKFPWRFIVYFVAGGYLFVDMAVWRGPLHQRLTRPWDDAGGGSGAGEQAAVVYGRPVTRLELAEALRAYLWQRGESWDALSDEARARTRWLVLEQLVNDRIVRAFRIMNRLDEPVPDEPARREVEMLRRQFVKEGEWEQRLTMQARTTGEFQIEAWESLSDTAWVEEKIRHRLAEITEELARGWHKEHREEMKVSERFRAAHLFLSAHDPDKPDRAADVAAVQARLTDDDGEAAFAKLAKEFSEDERSKIRGGDLGWFTAERMPEDFMDAVRAIPVGRMQGPVRTKLGWHWIRVTAREPERTPEFEEVREEIMAHLTDERRALAVKALIAELRKRSLAPTRFLYYFPEVIESAEPAGREG